MTGFGCFAFCVLLVFQGGAPAAELPAAVIAVLDYQFVMREATAAKDVRRQIQTYRAEYQKSIAAEEAGLRDEEQSLKRQRTVLSAEAFADKRREFERRVVDMRRRVQDRTRSLDRSYNVAMAELQKAVVPIVKQLTDEKGFNIVVDKSQVLFAKRALDITDVVLRELDAQIPRVKVPAPQN